MGFILRKYNVIHELGNQFHFLIGVTEKYETREEADQGFWKRQIFTIKKEKDNLYKTDFGLSEKYKYERQELVDYVNENYPYHNEYFNPDKESDISSFNIPDELTEAEWKEITRITKLYYYELIEYDEEILFYVPESDYEYEDYQGNLKQLKFEYPGEGGSGTIAFNNKFEAKIEVEKILEEEYKISEDQISDSYRIREMNFDNYVEFRFEELSPRIKNEYDYYNCLGLEDPLGMMVELFHLPVNYLEKKLKE